ncbi:hypothetical protein D3C84_1029750 [compost metagenome]
MLEKIVSGRSPATVFYFYHATDAGSEYAENAEIDKAGMAALAETQRVFQNRMASGKTRKKPL